jgi:TatD DNase family protein
MLQYFDAHTHLQFSAYDNDRDEVLERTLNEGIGIINVGTQTQTSKKAVELAHKYDDHPIFSKFIYATIGLHPIHTSKSFYDELELGAPKDNNKYTFVSKGETFVYDFYKELAKDPKVLAIGECGLDYFKIENKEQKEKQIEAFEKQILLSFEIKKPLMIHCRSAFPDLILILEKNKNKLNNPPGIVHFFSGNKEETDKLLNLGFYFTFGGVITFVRDYDKIIRLIPNDKILSETDAPYVAPAPYRGKRNEPLYIKEVIKKLAEIKNVPEEKINEQILENSRGVFGIKI